MSLVVFRNVKRSLIIFFTFMLFFMGLLFFSYRLEQNSFIEKMQLSLSGDINTYRTTFTDELTGIASDVQTMKQLLIQNQVLTKNDTETTFISNEARTTVENSFLVMTQSMRYFDQIRILDTQGMEISRVNNNNGAPYIVDIENLQDKSDRYYYSETIGLDDDSIYMSQMDLNIESDVIEVFNGEYKPVLRFATPLYSSSEELLGILVVNYLVNDIFNGLHLLKQTEASQIEIINEDGYYLYAENEAIEFGFMFDDLQEEIVSKYHDFDVLEHAQSSISQYNVKRTIYSVLSMDQSSFSESISDLIGREISLISSSGSIIIFSQLNYTDLSQFQQKTNIYIVLLSISLFIAYMLTRLLDEIDFSKRERIKSLKYLAEHDYLTKLPNRSYIMAIIEKYTTSNQPFALMFLDLDGFKDINDKHGHLLGDEALIESSNRIFNNIRSNDTVARVGGDEFIVVFDCLNDEQILSQIATRIINAFEKPFIMNDTSIMMGVSIGIAIHKKGQSIDDVIAAADQAMYYIKDHQKNDFTFYNK